MIAVVDLIPFARGGMADLFTAHAAGARVVVKLARRDRLGAGAALVAEAAALARVGAVAPQLLGHTRIDGRDALVLEYIGLPTLRTAAPALVDPRATAAALCAAIARIHAAGLIHADLTPDNVLVDRATGDVRLVDFGVAAPIGTVLAPSITVGYAAPERFVDGCRADPAIDVYALGVIAYELLTGRAVYDGTRGERRIAHATRRVPRVSAHATASRGVDDTIARAMAKAARRRPTCAELIAALAAAPDDPPVRAERAERRVDAPSPSPSPSSSDHRSAVLVGFTWCAGVAAVRELAAAAGAVIALTEADRHVAAVWTGDARRRAHDLAAALAAAGATAVDVLDAEIRVTANGTPIGAAIVALGRRRSVAAPAIPAPPPLVGRDDALATVDELARATITGATALVTVVGPAGLGKSRLAAELARRLAAAGLEVVETRAPDVAAILERDPAALPRGAVGDPVGAAALRAIAGGAPVAGSAAAHLAAPGALRRAAARALVAALVPAEGRPRAILIDDAHAADPVVLDAIELATLESRGGLLAIALTRPALATTRPRWGRRAATAVTIDLAPLTGELGRRLVRGLLPDLAAVPAAAIDRLIERCSGVPLYLVELVAALVRAEHDPTPPSRGAIRTDRLDAPAADAVLGWLVDDELVRLTPDARAAAEIVALVGRAIEHDEIDAVFAAVDPVAPRIELEPPVAVADLVAAGVLVDRDGEVRFRHELIREAVVERIGTDRRAALHRAIHASAIRLRPDDRARHASGAGDRAAAAAAWRAAAQHAFDRHDELAAELALGHALAADDREDPELLRRRGGARARLGRHDAAAADFARARELAHEAGDVAALIDALLDEATALDWALHHAASAARGAEAIALARTDEPPLRRARLEVAAGRAAWRAGDGASAIEPCRRAIALADAAGPGGYETAMGSRLMLGYILGGRGEIDAAAALLDRALVEATARGDLQHVAAVRCNRYPIHAARGDAAALRADLAAFAAAGRELGVAVTEYRGELYQALAAIWCDDDHQARVHAHAARRLEHADPDLFPRPAAALVLAELAARAGDPATAGAWCDAARTHGAAPAGIDAVSLEAIEAWLAGRLDHTEATALAGRAVALGEHEAAFQIHELVARTAARAGDQTGAARAHAAARTLPGLPRFMTTDAVESAA